MHRAHNNWWIYPVLGQLVGGALGGLAYELTVAIHHEVDDEEATEAEAGGDVERQPASGSNSKEGSPRPKE